MATRRQSDKITVEDAIGGAVRIEALGPDVWRVRQRSLGAAHDNCQAATWLRLRNPGPARAVTIHLAWAATEWMALRKTGYLKSRGRYRVLEGRTTPTKTVYEFTLPKGVSCFGPAPWYTNEDADRFLRRMARHPLCEARFIGETACGRPIRCLTLSRRGRGRKNVVILARMHAVETAGSFAVEATARHLLTDREGKRFLRDYSIHLFPVANPDGTAQGIKLTQVGPVRRFDMDQGGMDSDDPTIRALREEVLRLRPAVLVDHHSYLFKPPMIYALDKPTVLGMLDQMQDEDRERKLSQSWIVHQAPAKPNYLRDYCHKRFNTVVIASELPWQGRLPSDIAGLGVRFFRAVMKVAEERTA